MIKNGYKGTEIPYSLGEAMSNMLRITDGASLAFHTMAFLVKSPGRWISTREIASELGVSENHLAKVCQRLAKAGLVESVRGPGGGFRLAKSPAEITLLEVYEAIEGVLKPIDCFLGKPVCQRSKCIFGNLIHSVNTQVKEYLASTTLDYLCCKS